MEVLNPSNFTLDIYVALLLKTFEIRFILRVRGVKKGEPEDRTQVCFRVEPLLKQITQVPVL